MPSLDVAAHRYLMAQPVVEDLVAEGLLGSDTLYPAWVFRSAVGDPSRAIEGSGKCGIVISHTGYWALQNRHNTEKFPILRILIYADSTRDDLGTVLTSDAADKCVKVYDKINPLFHDPGRNISDFDGVRIHSIYAGGTFQIQEMPGTDEETVYGQIMYNISTD